MKKSFRQHFNFSSEYLQLNSAGMPPLMVEAQQSFATESAHFGAHGYAVVPDLIAHLAEARQDCARLVGTSAERVCFVPNFATGASIFAHSFPWQTGDRILSLAEEYPSNAYVWQDMARRHSGQLDLLPLTSQKTVAWPQFLNQLSQAKPAYRVVAISWVQSETGVMAPLAEIAKICRQTGTLFFLDAIQGLGSLPLNIQDSGVDVVCSGSHKWLCGPPGQGFLAFRDDSYQEYWPILQGAMTFGTPDDPTDFSRAPWTAAHRFEPGAAAFFQIFAAQAAWKVILAHGEAQLAKEIRSLRNFLTKELRRLDFQIFGEIDSELSGGITTFRSPRKSTAEISAHLQAHTVIHSAKRTGLRLSPHAFNTEEELAKVLKILCDEKC